MKRIALASLVVAVVAAVAMLTTAQAATPVLKGEVGPGFTIEVKKAGKKVKTLKAGKYTIKVEDKASIHNKKTSVSFSGEATWTVKLKPGRYTYQCDPHAASGMKGRFKVTR